MSKIIPVSPAGDESMEITLDSGVRISLSSLVHFPHEAKVSTLVDDSGGLLGTILYVWGTSPADLGVNKKVIHKA